MPTSTRPNWRRESGSMDPRRASTASTSPCHRRHNLLNAAAALGVARALDLPLDEAAAALGTYGGVHRRFERKGEAGGARFVDDYAIHPTEIASVVEAARAEGGRVVAVFQPHRYSRTAAMWRELGESLAGADVVVVTDVYAAWEEPIPGVTGKLVVDALAEAAPGQADRLPAAAGGRGAVPRLARHGTATAWSRSGPGTSPWSPTRAWASSGRRRDDRRPETWRGAELILRSAVGPRVRTGYPAGAADQLPARRSGRGSTWRPTDDRDLEAASAAIGATGLPWTVIGKGSNLLVSDAGFPGLVIRLGKGYRWAAREGSAVRAGGAMPLPALAGVALSHGLAGLEFAVAIPATLGGAVRMNAGAHHGSMDTVVRWVDVFELPESSRSARWRRRRGVRLPALGAARRARSSWRRARPARRRARLPSARRWRRPAPGAVRPSRWRSPTAAASSRTRRATTRRGWSRRWAPRAGRSGEPRCPEKHANFVVASPGATASDVWELIGRVQRLVEDRFGVSLEREVQLVGEFDGSAV